MASTFSTVGSGKGYGCSDPTSGDRSHIICENLASSSFVTMSDGSVNFTAHGSAVVNTVNLAALNMDSLGASVLTYMAPPVPTGFFRISSTSVAPTGGWPYYQWATTDVQELVNANVGGRSQVFGVGSTA